VLAQESRDARMTEAEKKAAALPPKLTVPMILFFLPVLIGVILGPAAIQVMDNFSTVLSSACKGQVRGLMFLLQVSIRSEGPERRIPIKAGNAHRRTHGTGRTVGDRCLYQSEISWCSCGPNP
jgi:hypothetical protein